MNSHDTRLPTACHRKLFRRIFRLFFFLLLATANEIMENN